MGTHHHHAFEDPALVITHQDTPGLHELLHRHAETLITLEPPCEGSNCVQPPA